MAVEEVPFRHGRRLLNHVVDERAQGHARPYASIPRSGEISDGYRDIEYSTFASAIEVCAAWLRDRFGASAAQKNIAYVGPTDLRHNIFALAAVKAGYVMFFPSPRNTVDAFDSMLNALDVVCFVTAEGPIAPVINQIMRKRQMRHEIAPSQEELLDEAHLTSPSPLHADFEEMRMEPFCHLHTSGSTGVPKVVTLKHGYMACADALQGLSHNPMERYREMRMFIPFPAFHVAGILNSLSAVIFADGTAVYPPPGVPITAELIHAIHLEARVEYSFLAPSLLNDLAKKEEYVDALQNLKGLSFSGGPCSEETYAIVSRQVTVHSSFGATEYGGLPMWPKDPEDYNYVRFNEDFGVRLHETAQPGLFELVFHRLATGRDIQNIFITFPELDEYHTKDCFSKHPTKPGLWKYECRLDDVIVLSNGEKFNPVQTEGTISACPDIAACHVFGQGHFELGLMVEKKNPDQDDEATLSNLSPFLEKANRLAPAYAAISVNNVLILSRDQALPQAAKGTVQRAQANRQFQQEIENFYSRLEESEHKPRTSRGVDFTSLETIRVSLLDHISSSLMDGEARLGYKDNIFNFGMDSLQVINLTRAINRSNVKSSTPIDPTVIYENPTVDRLASILYTGPSTTEYSDFDGDTELEKSTWQSMDSLYNTIKAEFDGNDSSTKPSWSSMLLTMLKSSDPPPLYQPDGGFVAWMQVLGSFLVNFNNWGLVNTFGVFQAFYETEYLRSYSGSQIAWIGTVQGALLLLVGSLSGPLFDKGYFGAILVLAGLGLVFALMMLSLASSYYQIMLAQGVLLGVCSGLLYIPSIALIPLYFKTRRGLALGLATAGGSAGGVVYPVVFRALLNSLGFGWATRIMGFLALSTLATASLLIKPVGARSTRQIFDREAFLELPYMCYLVSGIFLFAGVLVPYFLCTTYAYDVLAINLDLSFNLLAVLNGAQFIGRIAPAVLSDWTGPETLLGGATLAAGVLGYCWIAVNNLAGYVVWLVFYGLISGMVVTLPAVVLPYICPSMSVIGTRLGMVYSAAGVGFLISSPVALALNSRTNRFLGSQVWIGACCFVGLLCYVGTWAEARRRRRAYERNRGHRPYLVRRRTARLDDSLPAKTV